MKRIIVLCSLVMMCIGAWAQVNVQLHYDLGRNINSDKENDRQKVTTTIEQFRPDRLGSIYYFIDLDFYKKGMKGAYIEFSREFNIANGFAAHAEYNGGLTSGHYAEYASQFQHALLLGPAYNWASKDFHKTFSVQAMYKQYFKGQNNAKAYAGFQLTGVWGLTFGERDMFTFSGFVDLWRNHKATGKYNLIVLSEPQFWFNFNSLKNARKSDISIGTEFELSNNFIYPTGSTHQTFFFNPTIAIKWTMR